LRHHPVLRFPISFLDFLGTLHRFLRVEGIAVKVESSNLTLVRLLLEGVRRIGRIRRREDVRAVVFRLGLFGTCFCNFSGSLGILHRIGQRLIISGGSLTVCREIAEADERSRNHGHQQRGTLWHHHTHHSSKLA